MASSWVRPVEANNPFLLHSVYRLTSHFPTRSPRHSFLCAAKRHSRQTACVGYASETNPSRQRHISPRSRHFFLENIRTPRRKCIWTGDSGWRFCGRTGQTAGVKRSMLLSWQAWPAGALWWQIFKWTFALRLISCNRWRAAAAAANVITSYGLTLRYVHKFTKTESSCSETRHFTRFFVTGTCLRLMWELHYCLLKTHVAVLW